MKKCVKCSLEKETTEFKKDRTRKDGLNHTCKSCVKEYRIKNKSKEVIYQKKYREDNKQKLSKYQEQYNKKYYEMNKEKESEKNKKYYIENKEKLNAMAIIWHKANPDKVKKYRKKHYLNNIEKIKEYQNEYNKKRKKIDELFKLKGNIRTLIANSFKNKNLKKNNKTVQILGCSFNDFKQHLESKFESWMNWGNYGLYNGNSNYGWDIDHITPLSMAKTEEDVIKLNHYSNLQPLCSKENRDIKINSRNSNI